MKAEKINELRRELAERTQSLKEEIEKLNTQTNAVRCARFKVEVAKERLEQIGVLQE